MEENERNVSVCLLQATGLIGALRAFMSVAMDGPDLCEYQAVPSLIKMTFP